MTLLIIIIVPSPDLGQKEQPDKHAGRRRKGD